MKENKIAKGLFRIGTVIIIVGSIVSFLLGALSRGTGFAGMIAGMFASIVLGSCLVGFSEIINLLQMHVHREDMIIDAIRIQTMNNQVDSLKASLNNSRTNIPKE